MQILRVALDGVLLYAIYLNIRNWLTLKTRIKFYSDKVAQAEEDLRQIEALRNDIALEQQRLHGILASAQRQIALQSAALPPVVVDVQDPAKGWIN